MNIRNKAITQYHDIDGVTSMCVLNRDAFLLGASSIDLFGYQHSDDKGTNIDAMVKFVGTDFGIDNRKHLRSSLLSYYSDGELEYTWTADENETHSEAVLPIADGRGYRNYKIRGNREVVGTFIEFTIANKDGCDFTLNGLSVVPILVNVGKNV
jgi:hypothetical protein